ncbi:MAG: Threonylcarbamoyladenosine tRNA methylthiotransferase MtaB [Gemmatimonadaceae bacterium]|nr:Threonylcarbamoyladenosine tRNA methylthiotransferase MtaB [Gemmatimonadaceae bacterium]
MKVYLQTFGCRANQYDSEAARTMIEAGGVEIVAAAEDADVAIFNSCAVTHEAVVDLRKSVRRTSRRRAGLRSVVMGCAAAVDRGDLATLPSVTHVIPGTDLPALATALSLDPRSAGAIRGEQRGTRALLRVQDGCDEHCTFCATTVARGANRSRKESDLVGEARRLGERHPEIVLTGIHIGTYGRDIGESLGRLVDVLIRSVPNVRFRLSSVEATEVDDRLASLFSDSARLAPHLHAPLQSGADQVLRRMGRHWYTADTYASAVRRLVSSQSAFALGADVIAGFPGETEEDHRLTMDLIDSLPFTYLHVFPFSCRPGTPAERLNDQIDPPTVARRARELRELGARKAAAYATSRHGTRADVVVLKGDGEGLTEDNLVVRLDGPALPRGTRVAADLFERDGRLLARPLPLPSSRP